MILLTSFAGIALFLFAGSLVAVASLFTAVFLLRFIGKEAKEPIYKNHLRK